ncbi:Metallo-peptidase family M12 [Rubritalea squalenifaciens DSM 18772]|uniref:Metallo-peptidase family M12 n=1 Tax=Rubritalea squalenifaciens DSM 18772 TaxID=1123071 RepID=A0A1M6STZ6_9BACT|nr:LamG-like jellyroll fold domain-containing protein [Rubritalea squalenifaciens]SHK48169.1 Metallo-peptidase family M12 [Rubritalea squalenifaciens DSM 18772]
MKTLIHKMLRRRFCHAVLLLIGSISIAQAAPSNVVQSVTYNGETITMRMDLQNLRGSQFELWAQNASGGYDTLTPVDERSYIGTVDEYPGAVSCGILQDDGQFLGAVYFDRGVMWRTLGTSVIGTRGLGYGPDDFTNYQYPSASSVTAGQGGTTMYAYDIGIDAEYGYYSGPGGSDTARTFELIEYSVCVTRAIYMRDVLLRPYLGRVIIRTNQSQDPYNGLGGGTYLDALRTHWNANHTAANSDLVAGVTPGKVGGGLAWVGVVGTSSGYSVNDSGSSGHFDVVWRHEMGHNWNCGHFVGGSPEGAGLMGGNQPGRLSGCEAYRVLAHRASKISSGIVDSEGTYTAVELPPYASLDAAVFVQSVDSSVSIPVLANDHDANGQTISLTGFDSATVQGGTVSQAGQNLVYTPSGAFLGTDYFRYTITDSAGKTATGIAVIDVQPSDNLKLYLNLDETSGTVANDASVYSNNGSLNGTDFGTVSVAGQYGNGADLDGVDDHVTVSGMKLNSNTVTMTAWIKPEVTQPSWAGIIFDRTSGAQGLNFGTAGELRYHWNSGNYGWNSGLVPTPGVWTFVALVIEPNKATIYMNNGSGFQSAVNNVTHTAAGFGTTYVGRDPNSSARSFNGVLDEARVYGKAMTQADLQQVYDGGTAESPSPFDGASEVNAPTASWAPSAAATSYQVYIGTNQTAVANATTASAEYQGSTANPEWIFDLDTDTTYFWRVDVVTASSTITGNVWSFSTDSIVYEAGLVAHWKFDEGSGASTSDSSLNSNTGTVNGASWTTGFTGNGLQFDGVDDSVTFGNGPSLGGQTDFTVSAWIKTSASSEQVIIQQRNGGFNGQYAFRVTASGTLNFYVYGNSAYQFNFSTTATVNDGQWHYVAAVRDGQNGYIYIDGNPVAAASGSGTIRDLSSSIGVGVGRDIRDNNKPFNGFIDEVKIYNVAKSGQNLNDVYNEYQPGTNNPPVANNASGTVAEDVSVGTSVATVSASDPDVGDTLSFAITAGNVGGAFAINSSTGEVTTATALDYETTASYSLTVTVTDSGGLTDTAIVSVTVTDVNEGGGTTSYTSDAETMIDGSIISGSLADTQTSNNVYEVLREEKTNGKPSSRVSSLEHTWSFDIGSGGILVELSVEAYHSSNTEGDDFVFAYSTDGINFTDLITVTKTSDDNTAQIAPLPAGVTGTVYVRVRDTDRTVGNGGQDTISIDHLTLEVTE